MRDYSILARFLQGLQKDDNARFFYDLCADALVWSDEVPPIGSPDCDTFNAPDLRGVWRYRTTLILGRPEEKRRLAREEARKHFPNWPGFDPKRCDASLASTFWQCKKLP